MEYVDMEYAVGYATILHIAPLVKYCMRLTDQAYARAPRVVVAAVQH